MAARGSCAQQEVKTMPSSGVITPPDSKLETQLLELVQTHLDTFVKWDIMRHFHKLPHATTTVAQLARELGRDARVLEPELAQLARVGLLNVEELAHMRLFTYTDSLETRALVADFFAACQNRRFRVQAIYHVIRRLR